MSEVLTTFWALSDPVRLEIVDRVASGSELTVTQLAAVLPMTRQAITRHVRTLEESGLLVGEREGREHRYRVNVAPLTHASGWLDSKRTAWDDALSRLAEYLEE
ncbi:MAG: winged helix-turn-helix transcriptional regulator [Acidimicrobiia bacterium]|nr:winged helix-turn-helix transcriptional regulator [Acidimicrobiia bacterium]